MQPPQTKKTPAVVGTAGALIRDNNSGRLGAELGTCKTPGICNFDPGAFLKLYKIAHSEMTMCKSNNSPLAVNLSGNFRFSIAARDNWAGPYSPSTALPAPRSIRR